MKAISILGCGSGAGKSWITTALGAWLHAQGVRVAPFKSQNMSNNAWVTFDGGEIGRAQAVQAEACGLVPTVEMNPILLKPSGASGSQVILMGQAQGHYAAAEYYRRFEQLWQCIRDVLDGWRARCDVLLMEGAGSPVELNLLDRDLVNLRPCRDTGVQTRWVTSPHELAEARVIVLPGTKNTLADMRWLRASGLADAIIAAARRGALIIGICGGFQMLGMQLTDEQGNAGDAGTEAGLGLLPAQTRFNSTKVLRQVTAQCDSAKWRAYEIHMGHTTATTHVEPLQIVRDAEGTRSEGLRLGNVWGTYLHGWFDSPQLRARVTAAAGIDGHHAHPVPWAEQRQGLYRLMAEHLSAHINLESVKRYLSL